MSQYVQWNDLPKLIRPQLGPVAACLVMIAVFTAALAVLHWLVSLEQVTIVYLIPVMIAAARWGVIPAVVTALAAIAMSAYFFYEPIYDFRVHRPEHMVDLILFVVVAIVTGRLGTTAREAKMRAEAEALREALIDAVSHELRTPLSSIKGSVSVLAAAPGIAKDERLLPLVSGLNASIDRLNEHIQNLLDATRIKMEGIRPRIEWVDPGDIVTAAVERKADVLSRHHLSVEVASDLPLVRTDPALVEKALGQLIENATKYSAPGSRIQVSAGRRDAMVRLAVRDQGEGFAPEEREAIWERSYRSPAHREHVAGTGLGLWIARSLTTACGGTVDAFSAGIGEGAVFSLWLPVQIGPDAGPDDADE